MAKFVDYARIKCQAGDGGSGMASFRREKFVPRGGPDGGDGGKGGDVVLVGHPQMDTLLDFRYRTLYKAPNGENGARKNCTGRSGDDLLIPVPLGTVVTDEATGRPLADITMPDQRFIVAHGGRGGRGNTHFVSSVHQAPRRFEPGEPGEERAIILELKMIADVGLVGLPNAGKSTLLKALTAATPKIAPYPFTTLHPNLGVLEFDHSTRLVLADLPGLIEGASRGAGLGDRFLRHIERTGYLLHLVTDEHGVFDFDDITARVEMVQRELEFYGKTLLNKPSTLVLSQIDRAADADAIGPLRERLEAKFGRVYAISAISGEGMDALRDHLQTIAREKKETEQPATEIDEERTGTPQTH